MHACLRAGATHATAAASHHHHHLTTRPHTRRLARRLTRAAQIFVATPDGSGGYSVPDEPLAWSSPGRTLGVKWGPDGSLYMANAPLGLLQLVAPGDVEAQKLLLATGRVSDDSPLKPGHPIEFANSLDIGADGTVYLSSSTDVLPYK